MSTPKRHKLEKKAANLARRIQRGQAKAARKQARVDAKQKQQ